MFVKLIAIVFMSIVACVFYGLVHDQITARICVEYFTIGHPPVFGTEDPTLLGLGWGVIATWWVGVLLGVPLALCSLVGPWPIREPKTLFRPFLLLMIGSGLVATMSGIVGWLLASRGWIHLNGRLGERVPVEQHTPFLIDLFAHNASYLSGFLGGIALCIRTVLQRRRNSQAFATLTETPTNS